MPLSTSMTQSGRVVLGHHAIHKPLFMPFNPHASAFVLNDHNKGRLKLFMLQTAFWHHYLDESMTEMADTGNHHRHTVLVSSGKHFFIAH